ncbi:hypothetical protein [Streptomyces graminofaciens]|nr:hypothetical protein [Streptomyces graminofaciens]
MGEQLDLDDVGVPGDAPETTVERARFRRLPVQPRQLPDRVEGLMGYC